MIFVDTSIFIAAARANDPSHAQGLALIQRAKREGETLITSDHVLDETVTYLQAKGGKERASEAGRQMLRLEKLQMEYNSPPRTDAALRIVGKIDGMSFCDALSIVVMQELGIRTIYSFDSDFDKIAGIRRIE
ncbi:MAG: PIN domain-containing protein [Candidatus Micrarchaeota archaeon]